MTRSYHHCEPTSYDVVRDMILRAGLGINNGYSERVTIKHPFVPRYSDIYKE